MLVILVGALAVLLIAAVIVLIVGIGLGISQIGTEMRMVTRVETVDRPQQRILRTRDFDQAGLRRQGWIITSVSGGTDMVNGVVVLTRQPGTYQWQERVRVRK